MLSHFSLLPFLHTLTSVLPKLHSLPLESLKEFVKVIFVNASHSKVQWVDDGINMRRVANFLRLFWTGLRSKGQLRERLNGLIYERLRPTGIPLMRKK